MNTNACSATKKETRGKEQVTDAEREELKETAHELAREKVLDELSEPLSELAQKRAELKRLRAQVDELKEVTGKLSGER
jgi:hypothetical protein